MDKPVIKNGIFYSFKGKFNFFITIYFLFLSQTIFYHKSKILTNTILYIIFYKNKFHKKHILYF